MENCITSILGLISLGICLFFDLNFMECIFVSCVEILVYNFYMLNIIKSDIDYLTSRVVDMDERFMEEKIKEYY